MANIVGTSAELDQERVTDLSPGDQIWIAGLTQDYFNFSYSSGFQDWSGYPRSTRIWPRRRRIVAIGSGEKREDDASFRVARFFGDLSYPLYITHYPLIYIYTGWVIDNHVSATHGAGVLVASVALAYGCLKLYDIPVRRMLSERLLARPSRRGAASVALNVRFPPIADIATAVRLAFVAGGQSACISMCRSRCTGGASSPARWELSFSAY